MRLPAEGTGEDTFPLESPLTICCSRRMKVGVQLAMEVVMGKKAIGGGLRAGLLTGVPLGRRED